MWIIWHSLVMYCTICSKFLRGGWIPHRSPVLDPVNANVDVLGEKTRAIFLPKRTTSAGVAHILAFPTTACHGVCNILLLMLSLWLKRNTPGWIAFYLTAPFSSKTIYHQVASLRAAHQLLWGAVSLKCAGHHLLFRTKILLLEAICSLWFWKMTSAICMR